VKLAAQRPGGVKLAVQRPGGVKLAVWRREVGGLAAKNFNVVQMLF
jgi:hypothetical protein